MSEKIKLFEKFGIVDLKDPKKNNLIQLLSERVSDHIMRCKQRNVPPTNPILGSPLDEAEIEFILFHKWVFVTYKSIPDMNEIEMNYNKICNGDMNQELFGFGRAFIDISFFIDEKKGVDYERLFNINNELQNHDFFEYLELTPEMILKNKKSIFEEKEKKESARYERSCYHQLLSQEKVGTMVFRPSSYNRKNTNPIFDYYVITLKTGENNFYDQLLVYERGRGWCITSAKSNNETGEIFLNPSRVYLPTFFDILVKILSKLSLKFSNIKRYSSEQITSIYNISKNK